MLNNTMKIIALLTIITLLNVPCYSQKEDLKYAALNTISSGLIGGIGSGLNKHKGQSFVQSFKKGFIKGCAGGLVEYAAKYSFKQNNYIWPSRLINSLGSSMVYNATRNQKLFEEINVQFYLGYFEIKKGRLNFSIDAITVVSTIYMSFRNSFDLENTLKTGSIVFQNNDTSGTIRGRSWGNCIWYKKTGLTFLAGIEEKEIIPGLKFPVPIWGTNNITNSVLNHEIIHTFQYNDFNFYNPFKIKHVKINLNFATAYFIAGAYNSNLFEQEACYYGRY
jgi:hypothetical protein